MTACFVDRRKDHRRNQMEKRRRYPRIELEFGGFLSSTSRMLFAHGQNLSLRGAYLRTRVPDQEGTEAIFRLMLPGWASMIKIPSRVVWSNDDPSYGPLGMGIRFEGAAPWQIKRIAATLLHAGGEEAITGYKCR